MGRYSPNVLPDYGRGVNIGDALAGALEDYQQAKLRQKAVSEHEQDRAHMLESQKLADAIAQSSARGEGIMRGTAPHESLDLELADPGAIPATLPHGQPAIGGGLADALGGQFDAIGRSSGMGPHRSNLPTPTGFNPSASSAPAMLTTAGAFNMATQSFQSPSQDRMMAHNSAHNPTLHMQGNYEQLTPDYYEDRSAEGPRGRALARELAAQKAEDEHRLSAAHATYYEGRAKMPDRSDPVANHEQERLFDIAHPLPRRDNPNTVSPRERSARSAAAVSRQDAGAFDRRAAGFERPLNDPVKKTLGDTADFPALRDSASKYRAKGDSARGASNRFEAVANQAAGLADVLPPAADFSGVRSGSSAGAGAAPTPAPPPPAAAQPMPKFTRQQLQAHYQDALKRGADPVKAKARLDSLLKSVSP